jgi:UDP-N-acetylmuramoylalanine-D-glutamate ligase
MNINDTLAEREATHGRFTVYALAAQSIKGVMKIRQTVALSDYQIEALDQISGKIARILTGNSNHIDHWHDIAGYATLVERQLQSDLSTTTNKEPVI